MKHVYPTQKCKYQYPPVVVGRLFLPEFRGEVTLFSISPQLGSSFLGWDILMMKAAGLAVGHFAN
jgi:hypothetical protein